MYSLEKIVQQRVFESDSIGALVYNDIYKEFIGSSWADYEIETIIQEVQLHFANQKMSVICRTKTQGLKTLLMKESLGFFQDNVVFEDAALALNGIVPDFEIYEYVSPGEMAFAVHIADEIRPDHPEFSEDVGIYVVCMCSMSGHYTLTGPLSRFQQHVQRLQNAGEISKIVEISKKLRTQMDNAKRLPDLSDDTNPVAVQLSNVLATETYLLENIREAKKQMKSLQKD